MRLNEINISSKNGNTLDALDEAQLLELIELIVQNHNKKVRAAKTGYTA
jgi:hypothetical protein